ncbi:LytTR family transcriptional regulator [Duganella sp. BJB1802]|uniref:LytTR family DNA-binding domain-containing protein n=1 Tax=Duganella sp. BJB1802 TaxID=2744575 RepID=UPI001593F39F|nr:LytTR family DNA-binding domain-containing protein [Duganella sp. BJB1802]NVD71038.1 LytTR family transcriptional regulator [Duganella sp. BJB1802]
MTISAHPAPSPARWSAWLLPHAWVALYWLAFLLVLEPGNIQRASQAGQVLSLPHETIRILVASLLGATVTSAVQVLTGRFPLHGPGRGRHLLIHAAGAAGLALALVLASCLLAAWVFAGRWLPSWDEIRDQLVGNFTLLMFALAALIALVHANLQRKAPAATPARPDAPAPVRGPLPALTHVEVKRRGQLISLPLSEVDWIESQGNYVALHVGQEQHLLRDTVSRFAERLDSRRFLRIHRGVIVAVDRVRAVEPLTNSDTLLHLTRGGPLRASRSYAAAVRELAAQLCREPVIKRS